MSAAWLVGLVAEQARRVLGTATQGAAGAAGRFAADRLEDLVRVIREHFQADAGASDALDRLDKAPDDARRQAALEERLEEALAADADFAARLAQVAEQVRADRAGIAGPVQVQDAGAVAIGGDVSISGGLVSGGRDVVIGGPDALTRLARSQDPDR